MRNKVKETSDLLETYIQNLDKDPVKLEEFAKFIENLNEVNSNYANLE